MGVHEDALDYHRRAPPGKIGSAITKPADTQRDLSLAYSPGIAAPASEISANKEAVFEYTAKGNLVGVISNGTAVLGLGAVGVEAAKPAMEGKAMLFKRFADIDAFDVEVDETDPDDLVETIARIAPTFGAINLEDIKAPECFDIERRLRERLPIPVVHEDQHGTAIVSGAALMNAADIVDKDLSEMKIVFAGAGASALPTAHFYVSLGARQENIVVCDSTGIVTHSRVEAGTVNQYKAEFAVDVPDGDLSDAMDSADVFIGLSVAEIVDESMVQSMARDPILFAMANPTPEIDYETAKASRADTVVMATGRLDYPNEVNNVLEFPALFRGALDVRAREINEPMKIAAAKSLASVAKRTVPDSVAALYDESLVFGPEYIIPKPFDHRVVPTVATAVATAAIESGVARRDIDLDAYPDQLAKRVSRIVK